MNEQMNEYTCVTHIVFCTNLWICSIFFAVVVVVGLVKIGSGILHWIRYSEEFNDVILRNVNR